EQARRRLAARRMEEVDRGDLFEPPPQPLAVRFELTPRGVLELAALRVELAGCANLPDQLFVVGVARPIEERLDFIVAEPLDEVGLDERRLATAGDDLAHDPLQV